MSVLKSQTQLSGKYLMAFRVSTLITAGLLGALLFIGSINPVLAGDSCGKGKKDGSTTGLPTSAVIVEERIG